MRDQCFSKALFCYPALATNFSSAEGDRDLLGPWKKRVPLIRRTWCHGKERGKGGGKGTKQEEEKEEEEEARGSKRKQEGASSKKHTGRSKQRAREGGGGKTNQRNNTATGLKLRWFETSPVLAMYRNCEL